MAPAPSELDDGVDYYDFLSIEATATNAEIQRAYRRTNLKYHPDKFKPTAEVTVEQAAVKLDLLQKIVGILKNPATRAKYDSLREARRQNDVAREKMESNRRRLAEELINREAMAAPLVNSLKRKHDEHEKAVQDIRAESLGLKEAMQHRLRKEAAQRREAVEAQTKQDTSSEPDAKHRSVKITWIREGKGLVIDEDRLREKCEVFGRVDSLGVVTDRKRRVAGRKEKAVFGTGLVVFESVSAAQEAVRSASWDGIESITWAFSKDAG